MERDPAYLLDIVLSARKALQFVADLSWEEFAESDLHQNAVMRALEVVGEAARRISPTTRAAHPEIPWEKMIGMRNRLLHEYFRVNVQTVWDTVHDDLLNLIRLLEPLIPPETDADLP